MALYLTNFLDNHSRTRWSQWRLHRHSKCSFTSKFWRLAARYERLFLLCRAY